MRFVHTHGEGTSRHEGAVDLVSATPNRTENPSCKFAPARRPLPRMGGDGDGRGVCQPCTVTRNLGEQPTYCRIAPEVTQDSRR